MNNFVYAARPLIQDFFSTIVFVVLVALKVDVRIATGVAIAIGVGQVAWLAYRKQPIAALQWLGLALVLVFGAASFITRDARFIMFKPSIIYVIVGAVMLQRGWMLRYMPPIARGAGEDLMIRFGYVWSALMFVTAAANLWVVMNLTAVQWAAFMAVFPTVSKIVLFAIQYATVRTIVRRRMIAAQAAGAQPA